MAVLDSARLHELTAGMLCALTASQKSVMSYSGLPHRLVADHCY